MGRRGRPPMGFTGGPAVRGGRRIQEQKIGPGARAKVVEAHELEAGGKPAEAAAAFASVANICRERQLTRMATFLAASAARCAAKAGDRDGFLQHAEVAIGAAKLEGDAGFSSRTFGALVASLSGTAFAGGASAFGEAITQAVGVTPSVAIVSAPTAETSRSWRRHLPGECTGCGADVGGDKVVFNEDGTADCATCGSVLTV